MNQEQQCMAQHMAEQYQRYLEASEAARKHHTAMAKAVVMAEWQDYQDLSQKLSLSLIASKGAAA